MYVLAISFKVNSTGTVHTHTFSIVDGKKQHAFIREWEEKGIKKVKVMYVIDDFELESVRVEMRACKRQHGATSWSYKGVRKGNKF